METVVQWAALLAAVIEPHYSMTGRRRMPGGGSRSRVVVGCVPYTLRSRPSGGRFLPQEMRAVLKSQYRTVGARF